MTRSAILAALCAALTMTGCSGRVSDEESQPSGSSTTIVEVSPLNSPPPVPAESPPDPQPPFIDQEGACHAIVFGDLEDDHHLHFHEAPEPPSLRVDVRVEVDAIDDRDRRRQLVEQRLKELRDRR